MSKPYREEDLSSQLSQDRTWRLKEISDLKNAVLKADSRLQKVLLRAMATICYAHWEGYVKFAARKYLEHISLRRFKYDELDGQFLNNLFLPRLAALSGNKSSLADRCDLIAEILGASEKKFTHVNEDLVNTKSNLNFEVFSDICLVCGISVEATFLDRSTFIDTILLKRRNAIAHGEDTFVDMDDLDALSEETIAMMRAFGDALENHAYLKTYRSA